MGGIQNEPSMQSSTEPDTTYTTTHAYKLRKQQRKKQEKKLIKLLAKQKGWVRSPDVLELQCKQLLASINDVEPALVTKSLVNKLTVRSRNLTSLEVKVDYLKWKIQRKQKNLRDKQSKESCMQLKKRTRRQN